MIRSRRLAKQGAFPASQPKIGTMGHLGIFICSLGLIMLAPQTRIYPATAICLILAMCTYPEAFRRCLKIRWLMLMAALALPAVFFMGEIDRSFLGLDYSSTGLLTGVQIALRMLVVLVAAQSLTSSVDISSIAGLFERLGLHGLGFSLGVAMNLLPLLQDAATNAWHSMWMRGGLRRHRWRALQLLTITVMTNALSKAEEIALASEARAFSPERARRLQIQSGKLDRGILLVGPLLVLVILFVV